MKTSSLKLPAGLHTKLDRAAKQRKQSGSSVVRSAPEQFLDSAPRSRLGRTLSALQLAGDLVGCAAGPGDLSTNPKYFEGFGT
jgi:hypothetical protein